MRLENVRVIRLDTSTMIAVAWVQDGVYASTEFEAPETWDEMTRDDKIAWTRAAVTDHISGVTYVEARERVYPDASVPEGAKDDFENAPGWSTWTAAEAAAWIDANVTDLASAKVAMSGMARAIVRLRDITIES